MSFGRTTFGSLYDIIPGSSDIFIRRFQMGVQLSGILLAGIGIVFAGPAGARRRRAPLPRGPARLGLGAGRARHRRGPLHRRARRRAGAGLELARQLRRAQRHQHRPAGPGRRAAGTAHRRAARLRASAPPGPGVRRASRPTGATDFTVGAVPVFKYLESKDVDEVGYTLAHRVADDRSRVLLRRGQPGRLPAVRDRLHDHPPVHGAAGAGGPGQVLEQLLPVVAPRHRGTSTSYDTTGVLHAPPGPTSGHRARPCWAPPSWRTNAT